MQHGQRHKVYWPNVVRFVLLWIFRSAVSESHDGLHFVIVFLAIRQNLEFCFHVVWDACGHGCDEAEFAYSAIWLH